MSVSKPENVNESIINDRAGKLEDVEVWRNKDDNEKYDVFWTKDISLERKPLKTGSIKEILSDFWSENSQIKEAHPDY